LPHVTNQIADSLCQYGAQAFQLLTVRHESPAIQDMIGLSWEQITDIRNYLELLDEYELVPTKIVEPAERIVMETSEL
jgi:hypothetical protein